jgi:hypothetical protein
MDSSQLQQAGFSQQEINEYTKLQAAGFSEAEIKKYYTEQPKTSKWKTIGGVANSTVRPMLEYGGMALGGVLGSGVGPEGTVAGAALGYAGGKQTANLYEQAMGTKKPGSIPEELTKGAKDVAEGATMEIGGQVLGKVLPEAAKVAGKGIQQLWGRGTGTGGATIGDAVKSGLETGVTLNPIKSATPFDRGLRGQATGDEIVAEANSLLQKIVDKRGAEYVAKLEKIKTNPKVLEEVNDGLVKKLSDLNSSDKFEIKVTNDPKGKLSVDYSKSTIVEGQPVVTRAIEDINGWTDKTPAGLDKLAKRIGTYARQVKKGTPADAFLTQLNQTIRDGLKKAVPGYAEMTKGYSEASKLIEDIEKTLSIKMSGGTGKYTADQTLRRLTSAMKDNFSLRREMVDILGAEGGKDLSSKISGYAMSSFVPVGLSGAAPVLVGEWALAKFISPKFWPILAASSPRVAGEFLRMYGKFLGQIKGVGPFAGKATAYGIKKATEND